MDQTEDAATTRGPARIRYKEIEAKSVLVASKLPDADYVINPYTGCEFGCVYCYASFMGRFVDEPIREWGNYVYIKTNAVELLRTQLASWGPAKRRASVLLSSVTDPYQGVESKYRLTRGILQVLVQERYPGTIGILTKSPLVLRDVDLLRQLPNVEVGMTVTTTDDKVSRFLELRAPLASRRLDTLRKLTEAGLSTYAFVGPLLPHFRYRPDLLEELFAQIAAAGVRSVYVEHMNLSKYITERLWPAVANEKNEVKEVYAGAATKEHRAALDRLVRTLLRRHGLRLRLSEVLYHHEGKAKAAAEAPDEAGSDGEA